MATTPGGPVRVLVDLAVGRSLVVEEKAGLAKRWHALLCTWAGRLWTQRRAAYRAGGALAAGVFWARRAG